MFIRKATPADLPRLLEIYQSARLFMAQNGNPTQWANTWPPASLLEQDIHSGHSYVCIHDKQAVGTFFFNFGKDIEPTYALITDGKWQKDSPYGVIHRLAGDGSVKGIGAYCIHWCYEQCHHLRVDTHPDNQIMQCLLGKLGFRRCGMINVMQDNMPRIAFEK
ncbi:N-acetyltransferase family protein [Candidatus Avelusimicrobium facis]|uniref:GNAT family N-acetyltransferase n=1 Tax=Candidatus Avelusimicrobium facis TaxID=3416203 RepID=UPI003D0A3B4C